MRSVQVLRNIVSNYLRFVLAGLIGFVITPVLVHGLGDRDYGLWVTVFSLTGYFGLIDQGIRPSLVRYVSRDHARGDEQGVARTLSSALALYGALGALTLVATVAAAAAFTRFMRVEPAQAEVARQVILIAGASIALGFPLGVFGAALSGLQRYDLANLVGVAVGIARALAFVIVLRLGGGLVGLAWVSLAMNLFGHALSWLLLMRLVPGLRVGLSGVTRERLGLIGAYSGFAFVGALANSLTFQTDALVITGYLGLALVTPFALAAGLVDNARSLVHSASWVLAPTASELETRGETQALHELVIAGARYSVLLIWPVLFALLVFGSDLIATWVGARYVSEPLIGTLLRPAWWPASASAAVMLVWLVLPTFVSLPQSTASSVLYGVGRHRGVVVLAVVNALVNLGLSLLWVRPLGLTGVALGTAVPLAVVGGVATLAYTCRALELPPARYLWRGFGQPGLVTLVFLLPAIAERVSWRPVGWGQLALAAGLPWVLFVLVAWRLGLDADERRLWGRTVRGLLRPSAPDAGMAHAAASAAAHPAPAGGAVPVRVSAVLAAYNATWCIERALDSLLGQSRVPEEIIVCDDGSTDGTADLVERRYGRRVTVLRLPHRNASAARRAGIERSRGDWIAFVDADDRWLPEKQARQQAFLQRQPQVRWLTGNGRYVSDEAVLRESWLADYFDDVHDVAGDLLPPLVERCFPLLSATLVERGAYEAVGGLDPGLAYSYDYDLWLRLAARYPGGLMAEPLVEYYCGSGTLSRQYESRFRDDLTIMRRLEDDGLGRGPAVRRVAAGRAAALEFDLAIIEARTGRLQEARLRLRRALRAGPWHRRLLALGGAALPASEMDRLMRSSVAKRIVMRARRDAGRIRLPASPEEAE